MRIVPDNKAKVKPGFRSQLLEVIGKSFFAQCGRDKSASQYAICKCECGEVVAIAVARLVRKTRTPTGSCGCLQRRHVVNLNCSQRGAACPQYTHGGSQTRLYKKWCAMLSRCELETSDTFQFYGARGISVCQEWHDFAVFRSWCLSTGYVDGLTIDRIDPLGNYEPANCQWLTRAENSRKAWRDRNGKKQRQCV